MPKTRRISGVAVLIVCLGGSSWSETVFASTTPAPGEPATTASTVMAASQPQLHQSTLPASLVFGEQTKRAMAVTTSPLVVPSFAQRGWYGGRGRRRNSVAQAEMILGAVAAITGAAVLTYANRPECSANAAADGCSYGTKVLGTAVTAGGVVTFLTGALTWR